MQNYQDRGCHKHQVNRVRIFLSLREKCGQSFPWLIFFQGLLNSRILRGLSVGVPADYSGIRIANGIPHEGLHKF
jgi:hypothetical protein